MNPTYRIAVIADPHVHDVAWRPAGAGLTGAVRSWADTAASTRVFNESLPAFRAALDCAVAEGARLVIVPGDLTDDGQRHNIEVAVALIAEYERRHGLRVFMTPGNHDFWALKGRPQRKEFVGRDGSRVIVGSHAAPNGAAISSPETAMLGAPEALTLMADLGFQPRTDDLHFETPFGSDARWSSRTVRAASPDEATSFEMIDASYLIEPVAGLWLLSIDANIVAPRDGATDLDDPAQMLDPSDGGWSAVLRTRPHLLPWMRDVAERARRGGKALVAFSHYPVLDALAGASALECALFPSSGLARRAPTMEVARCFTETGVRLHLSGHLHVNDTAVFRDEYGGFFNIAVPSPVGFAPAMKLLDVTTDHVRLRTVRLDDVPGHDAAFDDYSREAGAAGDPSPKAVSAGGHLGFLDRHLCALVGARYMAREWPRDMAEFARTHRFADLERLLWPQATPAASTGDIALTALAEDWYRLRKAADLALDLVPEARLAVYRRWIGELHHAEAMGLAGRFIAFISLLGRYLDRMPTLDVALDLKALVVTPSQGRTLRRQTV